MKIQLRTQERPARLAAAELDNYLRRMGEEEILPPEWILDVQDMSAYGMSLADPALDDAFFVRVREKEACIYGSNARSLLLGVYEYLTRIGCRFLRPGTEYEIVPVKSRPEDFYAECTCQAAMRHRGVCIEGADSVENVLDFINWSPKIGFNSFFLQFKYPHIFLRHWYEHTNNLQLASQGWDMEQTIAADAVFDEALKERGLLQHRVGHGWTGEAIGSAATGWEREDKGLSEETTALLAQIGGRRGLYGGIPTNTNLCYSNEEAVGLFAGRVVAYAKEHPEVDYLHVWLADANNNVCECENCRQRLLSDWYVRMLNVIDEMLTAEGLKTRIVFLLYQELLWAPETERLRNPDRFVLMFAPISRTFMKSYRQAGKLPPVPEYRLNRIQLPVTMEDNLTYLKAWQAVTDCDSFIYDYYLGKAHYGDPGYVRISRVCCEDLKSNRALGMNGISSCQELRAAFPNALPNYVMGKVSFDTSLEFDEVAEDYYRHAYGEGWQRVLSYLTELSELYDTDYFVGRGPAVDAGMAERFERARRLTGEFVPVIRESLAAGFSCAVQERFWQELLYHSEYVLALTGAMLARAQGRDSTEAYRQFAELVCRREPGFQKSLDVFRVLEVTGNYTGLRG